MNSSGNFKEAGERRKDQSCNRIAKETKVNHYENSTVNILRYSELVFLNGILMNICQMLWLLRSGKVVGFKIAIYISNPWILEEGEVLVNEDC